MIPQDLLTQIQTLFPNTKVNKGKVTEVEIPLDMVRAMLVDDGVLILKNKDLDGIVIMWNGDRVEIRVGGDKGISVYDLQIVVYFLKSGDHYMIVFGDC